VTTLLAGCSEVESQLSGGDGGNDDGDGTDRERYRAVVEDFLDAAAAEDTDALADVLHAASPLHPDHWDDEDWEFQGDEYEDAGSVEVGDVTDDATVADVYGLEAVDFWFDSESHLEDELGSADLALADVDVEGFDVEEQDVWVFATADEEWRLFFVTTEDDTPEDPEEAFEEPIRDEDHDVVAAVDWDYEQEDAPDDGEWARVELTDSPGVEADAVRIESTIAGSETEFYTPDDAEGSSPSWPGSWASVRLNPDGDQIVVTAVDDGEETIVHRVHYEP